jgi:hypothetical protein
MGEFFKGWRRKILALNLSGSYRLAAMFSTPNRDKGRMLFTDGEHGQEKRHRQEDFGQENREEEVQLHHGWYRTGVSRSAPIRGHPRFRWTARKEKQEEKRQRARGPDFGTAIPATLPSIDVTNASNQRSSNSSGCHRVVANKVISAWIALRHPVTLWKKIAKPLSKTAPGKVDFYNRQALRR